jgi:hypothetical protein
VIAEYPSHHFIERPARSIKTGEKTTLLQDLKEVYELIGESATGVLEKKKRRLRKKMVLK